MTAERLPDGLAEAVIDQATAALMALLPDGTVLSWNRGACAAYGYQPDEAIGRRLDDLIVPPEGLETARRMRAEVLERGQVAFEAARRRKDGSSIEVEVSMRAVPDRSGQPCYIAVSHTDVTALAHLRQASAADARFRGLLEAAPDAMVIVGQDGRVVLVNAQTEALFGYRREELLGQPVELLIPVRYRGAHPGHRAAYFGAPSVRPMAGRVKNLFGRRKDGTEFAAEISLSPIDTAEGTLVTAAIRDITARRGLEEELRRKNEALEEQNRRILEASRLKSEFLANMSHELRTPLNGIIGFAELMHDAKLGPVSADHKEYLGDILSSSRHLLQLINDVLDLAKVESGTIVFRPEPVDLERLVREVCDVLRAATTAKRIQVALEIERPLGPIVADPSRLKQVLYNYLSNAVKFTPDEGRVTVRARPEGEASFRLEVADSGIGIDGADLDRLFVEFQQLDASSAKRYQGTGLGLALTRRIVEAQGGQVGVTSAPARGSTFHAVLPRVFAAGVGKAEVGTAEVGDGR